MITVRANHGTAEERALARSVVRWFAATHLSARRNNHIIVNFEPGLPEWGKAFWNSKSNTSYNSRSYTITVRAGFARRSDIISTILHELVHVQQMMQCSLYFRLADGDVHTFWKGRRIPNGRGYEDHPIENEAYRREKTLTRQYLADNPLPRRRSR